MAKRTLLSWSSGKDSAWALQTLCQQSDIDVVGLVTTINSSHNRVAMHAVRVELLHKQAAAVGLPLTLIPIPHRCKNNDYERIMQNFIESIQHDDIECMAFGDLFLEDIRQYRENMLQGTDIEPLFPIWHYPTDELSQAMVEVGLKARITCIDPKQLDKSFAGRSYDQSFLADLPPHVDPCGENGEFHSFAYSGPMFHSAVAIESGEIVERDGFVFADLKLGLT